MAIRLTHMLAAARGRVRRWQAELPAPRLLSPIGVLLVLAGVSLAMLQQQLLPMAWPACLALIAVVAIWRWPRTRWLAIPLFGLAWASLHGSWAMQQRLPAELVGADLQLQGRITGLLRPAERRMSFDFTVEHGDGPAAALAGQRLRLAWYGAAPVALAPGQRWQLAVRLKRPRGVLNPGGFDYERHALLQRIVATGHVRDGDANRLLAVTPSIDRVRSGLSDAIEQAVGDRRARFLRGLAVGDTRGLENSDWETLRATGLSHLLAISGLHIGLVAGFGALLARALYWLVPTLGLRLPRPQAAAALALAGALGYALLAGFGLPAQRSLLMIGAVLLATLGRRRMRPGHGLALAALVIVLVDPLAVLGAGFWLSFIGVLWLLLCLPGAGRPTGAVGGLLRAQWAMSVGLLPLTLWFFGQVSVAGAAANLVAVPWVSLVVVPLTLLGTALLPWLPALASWPLQAAAAAVELLWTLADWIAGQAWAQVFVAEASLVALLLGLAGVCWLLLPRPVPGKAFALLLLAPMLVPPRPALAEGELEVQLIDVGQGLSVLLRTREHALLYDAGPAFAGGLDLGESAVLPALRADGVYGLDRLVLSHGDNDHAGGGDAVRRAYPQALLIAGEPGRAAGAVACETGQAWVWSGVRFEFLHPPVHFPELRNDSSCVLRVEAAGGTLLLTGDIGQVVEDRLLRQARSRLPARVLVVPHHGSASSSGREFVAAVAPEFALIGVGHGNRFDHPRPEVLERYAAQRSQVLQTSVSGAIRLRLRADGTVEWAGRRDSHRRFWHER